MRTSKWFALTLAAAMTSGGFIALHTAAAGAASINRPARGRLLERAKEKLGITDDQAAQIKAILKADKENLASLLTHLHSARGELREAIRSDSANEASVRAASAKVAAVESDLAVERMKLSAKIGPILTPEQREKLAQFEAKMDDVIDSAISRLGGEQQ